MATKKYTPVFSQTSMSRVTLMKKYVQLEHRIKEKSISFQFLS